jgi:hypothetical protein
MSIYYICSQGYYGGGYGASRVAEGAENRIFRPPRPHRRGGFGDGGRGLECGAWLRRHEGSDQSNGKIGIAGKYSQDSSNRALANCCRLIETNIDVGSRWFLFTESTAPPVVVRTSRGCVRTPYPSRGARCGGCDPDNTPTSERRDSVARPKKYSNRRPRRLSQTVDPLHGLV